MYLMYYLNEDGKRVYTLKVRLFLTTTRVSIGSLSLLSLSLSFTRCFIKKKIARIEFVL